MSDYTLTPRAQFYAQTNPGGWPYPGLVGHLHDGRHMVLRSLDTLGGARGWVTAMRISGDLGLRWKGSSTSVAQHLRYGRSKGLVRSRLWVPQDLEGNDLSPRMQWRITPAGRREAWR